MLLKGRLEGAWRTTVLKMSSPRTVTLLHQSGDITGFRVGSPSWPHSSKLALFDVLAVVEVASRLGVVQCSVPVDMRWQQSTTETEPRELSKVLILKPGTVQSFAYFACCQKCLTNYSLLLQLVQLCFLLQISANIKWCVVWRVVFHPYVFVDLCVLIAEELTK